VVLRACVLLLMLLLWPQLNSTDGRLEPPDPLSGLRQIIIGQVLATCNLPLAESKKWVTKS
jgi:hypothetical protein